MSNPESSLPPGFRFHPTDEELILHYLRNRATSTPCPVSIIAEVDIYKFDPWELPARAAFGEKEWYFFSPRDRKYPNGARPNRAAASGYWKATGTDKPILAMTSSHGHENIGVKKALVFYKGRPPKGIKTNWIMHEYRLAEAVNKPIRIKDSSMRLDDWVLCRIYKKSSHLTSTTIDLEQEDPSRDDVVLSRIPNPTDQKTLNLHKSPSLSNSLDVTDYSFLSRLMLDNLPDSSGSELFPILGYNNIDHPISSNNNNNNNSHYLMQRLPTTDLSVMDNQLKRQRSLVGNQEEGTLHPSKKYSSSCTFTNFTNQFDTSQYHLINQNLFNQQILLNSHLQFQ